jgi:hypothetical protein
VDVETSLNLLPAFYNWSVPDLYTKYRKSLKLHFTIKFDSGRFFSLTVDSFVIWRTFILYSLTLVNQEGIRKDLITSVERTPVAVQLLYLHSFDFIAYSSFVRRKWLFHDVGAISSESSRNYPLKLDYWCYLGAIPCWSRCFPNSCCSRSKILYFNPYASMTCAANKKPMNVGSLNLNMKCSFQRVFPERAKKSSSKRILLLDHSVTYTKRSLGSATKPVTPRPLNFGAFYLRNHYL